MVSTNLFYNLKQYIYPMFLGTGIRDRTQNIKTCWPLLEIGFKSLFFTTIICTILFFIFPQYSKYIPNTIPDTIQNYQIWRLLTSFIFHGTELASIGSVLFALYILYVCMPDLEKQYSTAYIFFELFLQLVICNVFLLLIGYPFYYFQLVKSDSLIGHGILPLSFIFIWQRVSKTPNELTTFCMVPCQFPMKYVPWFFMLLLIIFKNPVIPLTIYILLGYYQHMILNRSLIRLPLSVYGKFDSLMPNILKQNLGYVKVVKVLANLREICKKGGCFESESTLEQQSSAVERVQVIGGGVSLAGNKYSQATQKSHWIKKAQELKLEEIKNQINIETDKQHQQDSYEHEKNLDGQSSQDSKSTVFDRKSMTSEIPLNTSNQEQPNHTKS